MPKYRFPKGFLWGAATASHQVEGNNHNNWTEWERSSKRREDLEASGELSKYGLDNFISGRGPDQFSLYTEDFALARQLGHTATRISIEWSRIEPEKGVFNQQAIEHYRDVIKTIRDNGMEPFVTMYHWPVPLWFDKKGGWLAKDAVKDFESYATCLTESLGDQVTYWLTINEPEIFTLYSYYKGEWPPQTRSLTKSLRVFLTLSRAHIAAYQVIKTRQPESQVGIAKNNTYFEAGTLLDWPYKIVCEMVWNHHFLKRIARHQDFIGLNHYFHHRFFFGARRNADQHVSDLGWELYPESIYRVLVDLKRYKKPIFITEHGLADAGDVNRAWFLGESLKQVHRAIAKGVDVRGYLHWTLIDNFEWALGYRARFGLVAVNNKTLKRTPRPSAFLYKEIIKKNGLD